MLRNQESKEDAMKLQFIHKRKSTPEASSLYCQWIWTRQGEGGRLVAIWMDREMRAFEGEFAHEAGTDGQVAGVGEVSGDPPLCVRDDHAGEIRNEEARQP
jgi:hypothetical protein